MNQRVLSNDVIRRRLLMAAAGVASLAMLPACGGGGGGDPAPSPAPPPTGGTPPPPAPAPGPAPAPAPAPPPSAAWSATGALVYRNSSQVGIYDFAAGRERTLDPGTRLLTDAGIGAQRGGNRFTVQQRTANGWDIVLYDKGGLERDRFALTRAGAVSSSAATISPDGTRLAFSLSEPRSASDKTYIERTLIVRVSDGAILATIDGFAKPAWLGTAGAFVAHHEESLVLHRFDAQGANQGAIGSFIVEDTRASFDASPDGRSIAYMVDGVVRLHDIQTGADRLLVQSNNRLHLDAPTFSPDGRGLAVLDVATVTLTPYVLAIPATGSVTLSASNRMSQDTIAEVYGRMGWLG